MENEIVKIFTAQDNLQAEMILTTLKDNDIPAYKQDLGNAGIMNVYGGNSKGGAEIFVSAISAEKAIEILKGMGL